LTYARVTIIKGNINLVTIIVRQVRQYRKTIEKRKIGIQHLHQRAGIILAHCPHHCLCGSLYLRRGVAAAQRTVKSDIKAIQQQVTSAAKVYLTKENTAIKEDWVEF